MKASRTSRCCGWQGGVLDAELAHVRAGPVVAVKLLGQAKVLEHHVALLEERRRRRQRLAGGQGPALREDPRIADRAAGDGDAIDARLADHVQAVLRREQVAAAEDRPLWADVPLHFGQKLPAAGADVALHDGAAVDGDRGDARGKRAVQNREELVAAFGRVVDAAAHLDRDRNRAAARRRACGGRSPGPRPAG